MVSAAPPIQNGTQPMDAVVSLGQPGTAKLVQGKLQLIVHQERPLHQMVIVSASSAPEHQGLVNVNRAFQLKQRPMTLAACFKHSLQSDKHLLAALQRHMHMFWVMSSTKAFAFGKKDTQSETLTQTGV